MSETFTKLFSSITLSSVWHEDDQTVRVWITLLALADRNGYVGASVPGLATAARVPIPKVQEALAKFLAPDPYSRSKEYEGRRIEEADRGWKLLNYQRFRDMRDDEVRRAYERERKRKQRHSAVPDSPGQSQDVPHCLPNAEADAEAEEDQKEKTSLREVKEKDGADAPGAPDGASPRAEPKARKPRAKPAALAALEAALEAMVGKGEAPALSQSLGAKASKRVSDYAAEKGVPLEAAAALLASSWAGSGTRNAWKLCDVPFSAPEPRQTGFQDREAREGRAAELRARLSFLNSELLGARLDGKADKEGRVSREMESIRAELRKLKGAA